jgi:hypothetical protein
VAQQTRDPGDDFEQAHDRQLVHCDEAAQAARRHRLAADAADADRAIGSLF